MEPAGMLADYMAGFRALIEAIAIERLFLLGEPGAYSSSTALAGIAWTPSIMPRLERH